MAAAAALATPALYPAFFFVLEKAAKSAGNAVIPTFPAHCPHGLQHLRHKRPTFAFVGESGYTLGSPRKIAHKGTHGETRGVLDGGWYHYPRSVPHVSETLRGQGVERQTLPLLGLGRGCSQRTQRAFGTAMRLCASLFRGVAAPLGCVIFFYFCQNCDFYALRTQGLSACARRGWYHHPQRALRVAETLDDRMSKWFICRFLASPISIYESPCRILPISALIQIACRWISRGHIACPWLMQA